MNMCVFPGKEPVLAPRGTLGSFTSVVHQIAQPASRQAPNPLASDRFPPLRPSCVKTQELLLERARSCNQIFRGALHPLKS